MRTGQILITIFHLSISQFNFKVLDLGFIPCNIKAKTLNLVCTASVICRPPTCKLMFMLNFKKDKKDQVPMQINAKIKWFVKQSVCLKTLKH